MRVGVNTGEVVVRSIRKDDLHTDYVPVGHSTNLAARMEQLAAPGSILVTEYTHKLTDGYFEFKELGADADQRGGRAAQCLRSARRGAAAHAAASRQPGVG